MALPFWLWDYGWVETGLTTGYWDMGRTDFFQTPELFGSNKTENGTNYITDGLFAYTNGFDGPGNSKLKRTFSVPSLSTTPVRMRDIVWQNPPFSKYLPYIHGAFHGQIHGYVGGTMLTTGTSALEPAFWNHHCNVDRWWWLWKDCHGYDLIPPEWMNDTHYMPVNPIAGSAAKKDPSGNVYNCTNDDPMPFYLTFSTAKFLPANEWPSNKDVWSMGWSDNPGYGGMFYRFAGPDAIVDKISSKCPDKVWRYVDYTDGDDLTQPPLPDYPPPEVAVYP